MEELASGNPNKYEIEIKEVEDGKFEVKTIKRWGT